MRLVTYSKDGEENWGIVCRHPTREEEWVFSPGECCRIFELSASNATNGMYKSCPQLAPKGGWPDTLTGFLELEERGMEALRAFERYLLRFIAQSDAYAIESVSRPLKQTVLCAPIPRPRLMWGLVQNSPSFWRKNPDRRIANFMPQGHQRPIGSVLGDGECFKTAAGFNVELGFVIGKKGKDIPIERAMEHVAGYTVVIDSQVNTYYQGFCQLSEPRDDMLKRLNSWFVECTCSWAGKKSDAHCVMGPWIVTKDEIGDVYDLLVYTLQNGVVRDRSHTAGISIGIERTIHFYSSFATLYPGDVIHMGTVGTDGIFIVPGDTFGPEDLIQAQIENIGRVSAHVVDIPHDERACLSVGDDRDWRDEAQKLMRFSPAARWYEARGLGVLKGEWAPDCARNVYTLFGNYIGSDKIEGIPETRVPCFLNGPATMIQKSGGITRVARRATTLDVGVEIGAVIKKLAVALTAEEAEEYILGYVAVISVSDRSFDEAIVEPATAQERGICQVYARWGDGYCTIGDIAPSVPPDAQMRLLANGKRPIVEEVSQYRHDAAAAVSFITTGITLFPGDVVLLGRTARRVALTPEEYENGVSVLARIDGVGEASTRIQRQ